MQQHTVSYIFYLRNKSHSLGFCFLEALFVVRAIIHAVHYCLYIFWYLFDLFDGPIGPIVAPIKHVCPMHRTGNGNSYSNPWVSTFVGAQKQKTAADFAYLTPACINCQNFSNTAREFTFVNTWNRYINMRCTRSSISARFHYALSAQHIAMAHILPHIFSSSIRLQTISTEVYSQRKVLGLAESNQPGLIGSTGPSSHRNMLAVARCMVSVLQQRYEKL
jgi:hypothetical protein